MAVVEYLPTMILTPLLVDILLVCIAVIKIAIIAVDILSSLLNHLNYIFKILCGIEHLASIGLSFEGAFFCHGAFLAHKNALVVGCEDEVQAEIATFLAEHGANVFATCKDMLNSKHIAAKFREVNNMREEFVQEGEGGHMPMIIHPKFLQPDDDKASHEQALAHVHGDNSQDQHCTILKLLTDDVEDIRLFAAAFATHAPPIDLLFHPTGEPSANNAKTASLPNKPAPTTVPDNSGSTILTLVLEHRLARDARVIFSTSFLHYLGNIRQSLLDHFADSRIDTLLAFLLAWRPPLLAFLLHCTPSASTTKQFADAKADQIATVRLLGQRWSHDGSNTIPTRFAAPSEVQRKNLKVFAYNPGLLQTGFTIKEGVAPCPTWREMAWWLLHEPLAWLLHLYARMVGRSPRAAAETALWLATTDALEVVDPGANGCYWDGRYRRRTWADILEVGKLERMWDLWREHLG